MGIATSAPSTGGTVANPNGNSRSSGNKSHPIRRSGKKGGGTKVAATRGAKGSKGSGYRR